MRNPLQYQNIFVNRISERKTASKSNIDFSIIFSLFSLVISSTGLYISIAKFSNDKIYDTPILSMYLVPYKAGGEYGVFLKNPSRASAIILNQSVIHRPYLLLSDDVENKMFFKENWTHFNSTEILRGAIIPPGEQIPLLSSDLQMSDSQKITWTKQLNSTIIYICYSDIFREKFFKYSFDPILKKTSNVKIRSCE